MGPPVHAHVGGGFEEQSKRINTIVVKIHGLASLAATLAATMMLSHVNKSLSASIVNVPITPATITDEKFPEVQLRNLTKEYVNHLNATVGFE